MAASWQPNKHSAEQQQKQNQQQQCKMDEKMYILLYIVMQM